MAEQVRSPQERSSEEVELKRIAIGVIVGIFFVILGLGISIFQPISASFTLGIFVITSTNTGVLIIISGLIITALSVIQFKKISLEAGWFKVIIELCSAYIAYFLHFLFR